MIADDMLLSRRWHAAIDRHPELEAFTQSLSITTFRYVPRRLRARHRRTTRVETYLNTLNEELLDRLQRGGQVFVSNAVIGGRYALRACIVNFHTTAGDVSRSNGDCGGIGPSAGRSPSTRGGTEPKADRT